MTRTRRIICGLLAALAAITLLAGCSGGVITRTVDGKAVRSGSGGPLPPRNDDAEKKYPNLQKECEVLDTNLMAKTVGADPLDIQSTFVGAVCRWQAANPAGLIDITRFWYEQGSLDNERKIAGELKYQIENRAIVGVPSIVMKPNDSNGACGVASDGGPLGVVGWWVNPQSPGINACEMAVKLMELTLATNA
jgi:hypothetical protein